MQNNKKSWKMSRAKKNHIGFHLKNILFFPTHVSVANKVSKALVSYAYKCILTPAPSNTGEKNLLSIKKKVLLVKTKPLERLRI